MADRRSLMGKIHIAKKVALLCSGCGRLFFGEECPDCGNGEPRQLDDYSYRAILDSLTGYTSCAEMTERDLQVVADYFDRAGFREAHPHVSPKSEERRQRLAVMHHIKRIAPGILGSTWESRIEGFVRSKIGKATLEWCDADELRKVVGWIHRYQKYNQRRFT
jgi:phage gp16-like protein